MTQKKLFKQLQENGWIKRDSYLQYLTPTGSYWIRYDKKDKSLGLRWFSHKYFCQESWTEDLADTIMGFIKRNDIRFNCQECDDCFVCASFDMEGLEDF